MMIASACSGQQVNKPTSNMNYEKETSGQKRKGSMREGTTIKAIESGLQFQVPGYWVKWYEENENYPNFHLAPSELDEVENAEGEWDKEFAMVVNSILPFNQCVAHVGREGWGSLGRSYIDLQVRAYVLTLTPEEIEKNAVSKGAKTVEGLTGKPVRPELEKVEGWNRILFSYPRLYVDYSANAFVDLRVKQIKGQMIAFAFMYTDQYKYSGQVDLNMEIEEILESVVL